MKEEILDKLKQDYKKQKNTKIDYKLYNHYLYEIEKNDTNGIYVYIGTYSYSNEIDIIHGSNDFVVDYDSHSADYRVYFNIEQKYPETINISLCKEFEKNNIIIDPKSLFNEREYYEIQRAFFTKAIKENQESAKKMILKKYSRLNKY